MATDNFFLPPLSTANDCDSAGVRIVKRTKRNLFVNSLICRAHYDSAAVHYGIIISAEIGGR